MTSPPDSGETLDRLSGDRWSYQLERGHRSCRAGAARAPRRYVPFILPPCRPEFDNSHIPEKAGKLSKEEVKRLPKVRKGLGLACQMTAAAMVKPPDRLNVPGVTADGLAAAGLAADAIDSHVIDAENITLTLNTRHSLKTSSEQDHRI